MLTDQDKKNIIYRMYVLTEAGDLKTRYSLTKAPEQSGYSFGLGQIDLSQNKTAAFDLFNTVNKFAEEHGFSALLPADKNLLTLKTDKLSAESKELINLYLDTAEGRSFSDVWTERNTDEILRRVSAVESTTFGAVITADATGYAEVVKIINASGGPGMTVEFLSGHLAVSPEKTWSWKLPSDVLDETRIVTLQDYKDFWEHYKSPSLKRDLSTKIPEIGSEYEAGKLPAAPAYINWTVWSVLDPDDQIPVYKKAFIQDNNPNLLDIYFDEINKGLATPYELDWHIDPIDFTPPAEFPPTPQGPDDSGRADEENPKTTPISSDIEKTSVHIYGVDVQLRSLGSPISAGSDYAIWKLPDDDSPNGYSYVIERKENGSWKVVPDKGWMNDDEASKLISVAENPNRTKELQLAFPADEEDKGSIWVGSNNDFPDDPNKPTPVKPLDPNVQILVHALTNAFASLITTGSKVSDAILHQVVGTVGGNVVEALLREQWPTLNQLLSPKLDGNGNPVIDPKTGQLVGGPMTLVGNIASSIGGIFGAEAGQGLFDSLGLDPKIGASLGGFLGSYATNDLLKLVDAKDFGDLQGLSNLFGHFIGDSTTTAADTANAVSSAASAGQDVLAAANATAIGAVVNLAFSIAMGTANIGQAATAAVDIALAASGMAWAIPIANLIMSVIPFPVAHPTGVGDSLLVDNRFEEATGMGFHDGSGEQAKAMTDVAVGALNGIISQVGGMVVGGGDNATLEFMYRGSVWYGPGGVESKDTSVVLQQGIINAAKSLDFDGGDPMVKRAIQRSPAASMDELSADIGVAQAYTAYLNNKDVLDQAIAKDPTSDQAKSWKVILDRARQVLALDTPLAGENGTFVSYDGLELTGSVIAFDLSGDGFHPAEIAPAVLHHLSTTNADSWAGTMKPIDGSVMNWEDGRAFRGSDSNGGGDIGDNPDWVSEQIGSVKAPRNASGQGVLESDDMNGGDNSDGTDADGPVSGETGEGGNQGSWGTRDVSVWTDNPVDPNHVTAHIAVNIAKDAGGPEGPTQFTPTTVVQSAGKTYAASGLSDVDGDGKDNRVSTLGPNTGVLVRATTANDGAGIGQQSFAAVQGGASLPDLIKTYDTNRDGIIDGKDSRTSELEIWRDLDRDGKVDQNELYSLAQVGITQLDFTSAGRTAIMGEGGSAVLSEGTVDVGAGHTLVQRSMCLAA